MSFNFIKFSISKRIYKIIYVHKSTTNTNHDLVTPFYLDIDPFLPKLVNSFTLANEHNF